MKTAFKSIKYCHPSKRNLKPCQSATKTTDNLHTPLRQSHKLTISLWNDSHSMWHIKFLADGRKKLCSCQRAVNWYATRFSGPWVWPTSVAVWIDCLRGSLVAVGMEGNSTKSTKRSAKQDLYERLPDHTHVNRSFWMTYRKQLASVHCFTSFPLRSISDIPRAQTHSQHLWQIYMYNCRWGVSTEITTLSRACARVFVWTKWDTN